MKQYTAAVKDFDEAIKLAPTNVLAHSDRGSSHLQMGKYDNAIADFHRCDKLEPARLAAFTTTGAPRMAARGSTSRRRDFSLAIDRFDSGSPIATAASLPHARRYSQGAYRLRRRLQLAHRRTTGIPQQYLTK